MGAKEMTRFFVYITVVLLFSAGVVFAGEEAATAHNRMALNRGAMPSRRREAGPIPTAGRAVVRPPGASTGRKRALIPRGQDRRTGRRGRRTLSNPVGRSREADPWGSA